jgi:hypothetical protein
MAILCYNIVMGNEQDNNSGPAETEVNCIGYALNCLGLHPRDEYVDVGPFSQFSDRVSAAD